MAGIIMLPPAALVATADVAPSGVSMICRKPDCDLQGASSDDRWCERIAATLGDLPRQALSALVGYGLNDREIARYHGLPQNLVTELRGLWGIPPGA